MDVIFERTGARRYAVEIHRDDEVLRMDPAPGFDEYFPHDLQHLIVEEQLGLRHGIFGRLAAGGTSSTFISTSAHSGPTVSKREASRRRRKLQRKNQQLANQGPSDYGQSERATLVAWHDWLTQCKEPELRRQGADMAAAAATVRSQMSPSEQRQFDEVLPALRQRIDVVARQWAATQVGRKLAIRWK